MRWKYRIAAVVGAAGIGLGALALTAGGAHAATTLRFTEHETNVEYVIGGHATLSPTSPPGPGDSILFRSDLLQNGANVGFLNAQCVVIFNDNLSCGGFFAFNGKGDIYGTGLLRNGASGNIPSVFDIAITGGTFAYRNVHGDAHAVVLNATDTDWTLNLVTS
jgi:hypothetical protein